ncbi:MAG: HD domain-containing protein [Planctomycetaceae bacterium]
MPKRQDAEPPVRRLSELEPGEHADCFAMLAKKELGKTRDGKPFYRAVFRDNRRSVTVMIWLDGGWFEACEQQWVAGGYYKVRCRYFENQFGSQIELEKIRPVDDDDAAAGFNPAEFSPATRFEPEQLFEELRRTAEGEIRDGAVRKLTVALLDRHREQLLSLAAAAYHHHAYRGGFLEHVLSVTKTACYLADKYRDHYPDLNPPISKSLIVAGAILHDIGKIQELQQRPAGAEYTPAGRLIGHIVLGRDMIRSAAADIPDFDPELLLRLEHVILSHQALPEWGSPIPPSTPEALLVHYADDMDAKLHMMVSALESGQTPGQKEFTSRDNPLKRRIFRGLRDTQ